MEDVPSSRLMKMNAKEWPYMTLGCIAAITQGSVQPVFALVFGLMLGVSFQLDSLAFVIGWLIHEVSNVLYFVAYMYLIWCTRDCKYCKCSIAELWTWDRWTCMKTITCLHS